MWFKGLRLRAASVKKGLDEAPYGYCPRCSAPGVARTRCAKNSTDTCRNGHRYLSRESVSASGSRSVSVPDFSTHGSWSGGLLALGAVGVLAAAGMARRGARALKMSLEHLSFEPRDAVIYFDLVIEDDNIDEDAGDLEATLHEYAKNVRASDRMALDLEGQVYRDIQRALGVSVRNEGHSSEALICKVFPDTVEQAAEFMEKLPDLGDQISTPYGAVSYVRFYPQGLNKPWVSWDHVSPQISDQSAEFSDWLEIHAPRQLLGGLLVGDRYISKNFRTRS